MDVGGEAAAVQQEDDLAALLEGLAHGVLQALAKGGGPAAGRRLVAQVDQADLRQRPVEDALRQA